MAYLNKSIEIFKEKYLEVFGKVINDDQMRVINGGLGGFTIQSLKGLALTTTFTTEETGLEIKWSGYRDVYDRSDVPEFPYRQADIIYRNGKRTHATEYNIDGRMILEITWDETNNPIVTYNTEASRSIHAPRAFYDIQMKHIFDTIKPNLSSTPNYLPPSLSTAISMPILTMELDGVKSDIDVSCLSVQLAFGRSLMDALKAAARPPTTGGGAGAGIGEYKK